MIKLTKENFKEALSGNSVVFFHRLKGCGNCDRSLPVVEAFKKDGVQVFDVDVDAEKELVNQYAPKTRWNLPLTVYFENGEAVNSITETIDEEKLMELTETLQNISDTKLQKSILDIEITRAKRRKELFEIDELLTQLHLEANNRMKKSIAPVEIVPALQPTVPNKPVQIPKPSVVPELPIDPSEETACDGCQ